MFMYMALFLLVANSVMNFQLDDVPCINYFVEKFWLLGDLFVKDTVFSLFVLMLVMLNGMNYVVGDYLLLGVHILYFEIKQVRETINGAFWFMRV